MATKVTIFNHGPNELSISSFDTAVKLGQIIVDNLVPGGTADLYVHPAIEIRIAEGVRVQEATAGRPTCGVCGATGFHSCEPH